MDLGPGLTLAILYEVFLRSVAFSWCRSASGSAWEACWPQPPTAPPDGRAQGYVQKKLEATAAAFRTFVRVLAGLLPGAGERQRCGGGL